MEGLKLLILGDEPENIISMERLLNDIEGLDILSAMTEEEAINLCMAHKISMILMDKKQPGQYLAYNVPTVLAITDHGLRNMVDRSTNNSIEYLYRPLDDGRIKTKVSLLVQLLQARRMLNSEDEAIHEVEETYNHEPEVTEQHLEGKRVLLAEDNELNSFMVVHMLTSWGMVAHAVTNGKEALERLLHEKYDIVLMDTHMPVMGGYDAMKYIRTTMTYPLNRIPIISLSASTMQEEQEAAIRYGANEVMGKPFQPDILLSKIVKLLA